MKDKENEYLFVKDMSVDENGLTNPWHGISREEFEKTAFPTMIAYSKGEQLPEGFVPEIFLFLWNDEGGIQMKKQIILKIVKRTVLATLMILAAFFFVRVIGKAIYSKRVRKFTASR